MLTFFNSAFPFVLLILCSPLCAQTEADEPYDLPRVGSELDLNEIRYFQLFEGLKIEGYRQHFRIDIRKDESDSVRFIFHDDASELSGSCVATISSDAAAILDTFIQRYEYIITAFTRYEFYVWNRIPREQRPQANELRQAKMLPAYWEHSFEMDSTDRVTIKLLSGRRLEPSIIAVTNRRLLIWDSTAPFHIDTDISAIQSVPHDSVESITLLRKENRLIIASALAGAFISGNLRTRTENDYPAIDALLDILTVGAGLLVGVTTAWIFPELAPSLNNTVYGSHTEVQHFGRLHFHNAVLYPSGLPKPLFSLLDTAVQEHPVVSPDELLPYTNRGLLLQESPQHELALQASTLWFSTTEFCCASATVSAAFTWWPRFLHSESAGLGIGATTGFGLKELTTAGVTLRGRIFALEGFAGLRYLSTSSEMDYELRTFKRGISGDGKSTSLYTYNMPQDIWGELFTEFGAGIRTGALRLRLHFLTQMSPSVRLRKTETEFDLSSRSETITITEGVRLSAVEISINYRL